FQVQNTFSRMLPQLPVIALPKIGSDMAAADTMPVPSQPKERSAGRPDPQRAGIDKTPRFTNSFSYSGPSRKVRFEHNAQDGKQVYADRSYTFTALPLELRGSEYIKAANSDRNYKAVDLMELAVKKGSTVFLAYDQRLPPPTWLSSQFAPTQISLTIK